MFSSRLARCVRRWSPFIGYNEPVLSPWIVSRPDLLAGKPCIRGTRLSVQLVLELLAGGATPQEVLTAYPELTREGLAAALEYAAEVMGSEVAVPLPASA